MLLVEKLMTVLMIFRRALAQETAVKSFRGMILCNMKTILMALTAYQNSKVFDKCCFLLACWMMFSFFCRSVYCED